MGPLVVLLGAWCATVVPGEEFAGARTLSMGNASRGLALTNDAIFLNPAGMAIGPRYSIDLSYLHRFADSVAYPAFSVVDSRTSALAAGIAYAFERRADGKLSNHRASFALAYPLGGLGALGLTTKYLKVGEQLTATSFQAFTGDVGLILTPLAGLSLGVVGYNLIDTGHEQHLPILLGTGAAWASGVFALAFDLVANLSEHERPRLRYHAGGEYLLSGGLPVRLGWQKDEDTGRHRWSLGLGYVTEGGALDIAYRQDAHRPPDRELAIALRLFL